MDRRPGLVRCIEIDPVGCDCHLTGQQVIDIEIDLLNRRVVLRDGDHLQDATGDHLLRDHQLDIG